MAGQIRRMIDSIVQQRARGNATLELTTKTKLILKGINPDIYTVTSPDDPHVIEKLKSVAEDLGVRA